MVTALEWIAGLLLFYLFGISLLTALVLSLLFPRGLLYLKWWASTLLTIPATLLSYLVTPIACLFLDTSGNLRFLRGWLQPSDAPAIGDQGWQDANKGMTRYQRARSYLWRNPSQGFDQHFAAAVTMRTPVKVWGNIKINDIQGISGWYLILAEGAFHLAWVLPIGARCLEGGAGWRLNNIALGYPHPTMGQIVATPVRQFRFGGV